MGRLEGCWVYINVVVNPDFNSFMGRLEDGQGDAGQFIYEFQFLYGSIRRHITACYRVLKVLFQFLYGSIRRPDYL